MQKFIHVMTRSVTITLLSAFAILIGVSTISHAATNPAAAQISFTFDDARQSSYTNAAPILKKYGLKGTIYVTTGCVGMTSTPNKCHAANDVKYMTWAQVKALQNTYGWEVGSHSITHPYLASYNAADDQPKPLTQAQVVNEISGSKSALAAQGIDAKSFASPYGDYNMFTLQTIAKYYSSHRAFAEQNNNVYPYNDQLLNNLQVQNPVTLATVKAKIDAAIANKTWLVLTLHDVLPKASTNPNQYQWASANLEAVAAYVKTKQDAGLIKNVNVSEGVVSGTNLMPNGSFANGISGGWTTDSTAFTPNSASNGSFPEPAKSLQVGISTTGAHLFSPKVAVDSTKAYVFKSFLNVLKLTKGEIGYYIDEYDAAGNWISGQYKTRETSVYLENMNFIYQPSSVKVKTASLQVYTTAGSGISAYIDNIQLIAVMNAASSHTDLMPNGTFDAGLTPWKTDSSANITYNSSAKNVAFNQPAGTSHLFSPYITVTPGKNYYLENTLTITANNGGGVGFYIDEYDATGNWVSGQYRRYNNAVTSGETTFTYTPSSSGVAKAGLQVIFDGGSGLKGTIDNSRFWAL